MIQEAYCSFEVAKLLKEKGFNELCSRYYNSQFDEMRTVGDICMMNWNLSDEYLSIPTHQMAMAWLRDVHHIAINIGFGEIFEDQYRWWSIILNMDNGNILCDENYCASYEEVAEQSIKYVLEHVI